MRLTWIPILTFVAACGGNPTVGTLTLVPADGGSEAGSNPTSLRPPTIVFVDDDPTGGIMGGHMTIGRSPDDAPAMGYEVVVDSLPDPIAVLPSSGSDLGWDLPPHIVAAEKVGVRAVLGGVRSTTAWTMGDNYVRRRALPNLAASPFVVDPLGRIRMFGNGGLSCDVDSGCSAAITGFARPFAVELDRSSGVLIATWTAPPNDWPPRVIATEKLDGSSPYEVTFKGGWGLAPDGNGHVYIGGDVMSRCDLPSLYCAVWPMDVPGLIDVVFDRKHGVLAAWSDSTSVSCDAGGKNCASHPIAYESRAGHTFVDSELGQAVCGLYDPYGYSGLRAGFSVCDVATGTCSIHDIANGTWTRLFGSVVDTSRHIVWSLVSAGQPNPAFLLRSRMDGTPLSTVPLQDVVSDVLASGRTGVGMRYDDVNDRIHVVTWTGWYWTHAF